MGIDRLLPLTSADTEPHDRYRRYCDGNFAEVAPDRLSPLAWSVIGPPMECAFRRLYGTIAPRLRVVHEGSRYTFVGYFGLKPYHNLDALLSIVPFVPGLVGRDIARMYMQGVEVEVRSEGAATRRCRAAAVTTVAGQLAGLPGLANLAEERVAQAEEAAAFGRSLDPAVSDVLLRAVSAAWDAHVRSTCFSAVAVAWSMSMGERWLSEDWEAHGARFLAADEVLWYALDHQDGARDTEFLRYPFYEIGDRDTAWPSKGLRAVQSSSEGERTTIPPATSDVEFDAAVREGLERSLPPTARAALRLVTYQARRLAADRERTKSLVMRALHAVRRAVVSTAEANGWAPGWSGCSLEELAAGEAGRGSRRLAEYGEIVHLDLPSLLDLTPTPLGRRRSAPMMGVSPGLAIGPSFHPGDEPDDGGVLVCERADAPLLHDIARAAALVCEKGSYLSHVAVLARGFGIPAVVNVEGARRRFPTGAMVTVDGTSGRVDGL